MKVNISGKNMEVSDYLRDVVEKKAQKLERYFKPGTEMNVTLSIEKSRHIAEVTVLFDGIVLRGEEATGDMYSSIDVVLKKLERQIRKHRTRLERRLRDDAFESGTVYDYYEGEHPEEDGPQIVRNKKFVAQPMDIDDAVMQMELLGHSFFVFRNSHNNEVNVLYKRSDGDYGLIEPI
ncbi:MAG TPA: ribosome-associated translation inhibitor RaiA [Clostridiales bacterium]|nr:ribosome-associated translation inhibitor RaiA [Clostridiales bacterium]